MKGIYDVARHLVWLTQFGLSVVIPPVLCILGAVRLKRQFALGGWVVAVGVAAGVLAAISRLRGSLQAVLRQGRGWEKNERPPVCCEQRRERGELLQKHRDVFAQASRLAVAVALCIAAMLAVYALAGHFTNAVLLGAMIGFVLSMGNFLSLSITVSNALDRAANGGSPQKAQQEIQTSSVVRPVVLVIIYILIFRAKLCDPLAAILPLLFAQVCLKLIDFFRKDDSSKPEKDGDTPR